MRTIRIGHGYDVHRLKEGRKLILGGVTIEHDKGLYGHSDADVLIHALCDALLGAAALGDIGHHFPDTDPAYKDADSRELLKAVNQKIKDAGYTINNIDCTILAEAPKLSLHIPFMVQNLSDDLELAITNINVKATTTEGTGAVGREECIESYAVVTLKTLKK